MTARTAIACAAALGSACGAASGQSVTMAYEVSTDYATWTREIQAAPGQTLYVRVRMRLEGATALGLGSAEFATSISNWHDAEGDQIGSFTSWTSGVAYEPFNTGRLLPLASTRPGSLGATVDAAGVMRIGMYAGAAARPTVMLFQQGSPDMLGTSYDFDLAPLLFVYSLTLSGTLADSRDMVTGSYARQSTSGWLWFITWCQSNNGLVQVSTPSVTDEPATIHVIPAPGVATAAAMWMAIGGRRRRCNYGTTRSPRPRARR